MNKRLLIYLFLVTLTACNLFKKKKDQDQSYGDPSQEGNVSSATGIPYNDSTVPNSFTVKEFQEQEAGPNLVYIEGGSFVMGLTEEDVMNVSALNPTRVTIPSFYLDRTEIANQHWLEYMEYFKGNDEDLPDYLSQEEFEKRVLMPDTTVWAEEASFNDSYVHNYLRYPGFRFYPVVGVSWIQAQEFCRWRTKMVNHFNQNRAMYTGLKRNGKIDVGKLEVPNPDTSQVELPPYRLPTEAEWEYAARANVATQYDDTRDTKLRAYPWDGRYLRNPYKRNMGKFMANFKRGRGDYAGIAGKQNDGAMYTDWIYAYPPNDFGLYNMAGNVNEWVEDIYEVEGYEGWDGTVMVRRALRVTDSTSAPKFNHDVNLYDPRAVSYQGDSMMTITDSMRIIKENNTYFPNNRVERIPEQFDEDKKKYRVYKGGSWKDIAYWLSPGTKRFMKEDQSSATIGFRCARDFAAGSDAAGLDLSDEVPEQSAPNFGGKKRKGRKKGKKKKRKKKKKDKGEIAPNEEDDDVIDGSEEDEIILDD